VEETLASRVARGLEQILFGHRGVLVGIFCLVTAFFAWEAGHAHLESGLDKQAPADHPYVQTATRYEGKFGGGNEVLIGLQAKDGTIFTPKFFDEFAKMADDVFYLPGIDRGNLLHMFSPGANTFELTEVTGA
jgi:predicted RND superfamily exporter protein